VHAFAKVNKLFKRLTITADVQSGSLMRLNLNILKITSYNLCGSSGTPYTNVLIVGGYFKSVSRINTLAIIIVVSDDTPPQMKSSFVSENVSFVLITPSLLSSDGNVTAK
jgi:hypothetical protein